MAQRRTALLRKIRSATARTKTPKPARIAKVIEGLAGPYFNRLRHIGLQWLGSTEVAVDVDGHSGATRIEVRIPSELVAELPVGEVVASFGLPTRASSLPHLAHEKAVPPDIFAFIAKSGHRLTRTRRGDRIDIRIVEQSRILGEDLVFQFSSLSFQRALSEPVPFNRSILAIRVVWHKSIRPFVRLMLKRPRHLVTCFTSGNYSMSYPSRYDAENAITHILFPPEHEHTIEYGFSSEETGEIADILSGLTTTMLSGLLFFFLTEYVRAKPETDISNFLVPVVVLLGPLYLGLSKYGQTNRLHYYMKRSHLTFRASIFFSVISVSNVLLFIYAALHTADMRFLGHMELRRSTLNISLIYVSEAVLALLMLGVVIALHRLGRFVRYTCDNEGCNNRLYYRFNRVNCFASGRIMCAECYGKLCMVCTCNAETNRDAFSTGVSFDARRAENLCQRNSTGVSANSDLR